MHGYHINPIQQLCAAHRPGCSLAKRPAHVALPNAAQGVRFIHSHGIVHLDLKPGNVFVSAVHAPALEVCIPQGQGQGQAACM
jgi:serine/threonine protein kinase